MKENKVRRIALVQLNVTSDVWWKGKARGESAQARRRRILRVIQSSLEVACDGGADLAVFPECFPFRSPRSALPIEDALALLRSINSIPFIAGGYVRDGNLRPRNAVWLVDHGKRAQLPYFKQVPWDERIEVGTIPVVWSLGETKISPLICADVFGGTNEGTDRAGAGLKARLADIRALEPDLVVVPSYGGGVHRKRWQSHLRLCSQRLHAPVAFCNIAEWDGDFGGGGSAMYGPNGSRTQHRTEPGINVYTL